VKNIQRLFVVFLFLFNQSCFALEHYFKPGGSYLFYVSSDSANIYYGKVAYIYSLDNMVAFEKLSIVNTRDCDGVNDGPEYTLCKINTWIGADKSGRNAMLHTLTDTQLTFSTHQLVATYVN